MKAIVTRYHGPTNTRGSRITATDADGNRVSIPYDHALTSDECHSKAADALCAKMKWTGHLIGGSLKDGYVFVFDPSDLADMWAEAADILRELRQAKKESTQALRVACDNLSPRIDALLGD